MTNNKKFIIKTYGCQMNELDSERISYMLNELEYEETDNINNADLIIYNTCIVRENAELKVYGHVGAMKALKEKKPDLIIAVCGCMMEIEESQQEMKDKYRHVDIIFGTKNISSLPYLLEKHKIDKSRLVEVSDSDDVDEVQKALRQSNYSAYVNIIYGCDNFCTYCIVPYTRGRETSRNQKSIVKEIKDLAKEGYKEITLLGQNVNSYGKDLVPCTSFSNLLEVISEIEGIERIRFLSAHPKDFSDDLIDIVASNPKICNHIHLPLQSGSTRVLKDMNRTYSKEDYLDLIRKIRSKIKGVSISSDIIIGFPGETEKDIEDTIDVIKTAEFDQCYIYKYSKRFGTKAASMPLQIDEETKTRRFQKVLEVINKQGDINNSAYLETIQEVLVDNFSKTDKNKLSGRTPTNKIVNFIGDKSLIGQIIDVKIIGYNSFSLEGELA